jgi:hypothetical protein
MSGTGEYNSTISPDFIYCSPGPAAITGTANLNYVTTTTANTTSMTYGDIKKTLLKG